jgi:hypothetical protein
MDWETFKNRLGKIQSPRDNPEYLEKFLFAKNSIHLSVGKWTEENLKLILDTVSTLENRGAKRCEDYIVTCYAKIDGLSYTVDTISIHTTDIFMSQEDFVGIEMI